MWKKRKKEVEMEGFLTHVHEGKDVPTSGADDRRSYALRLHTEAFASNADEANGGRPTHVHTGCTYASFRTWKCSLTGGLKNYTYFELVGEAIISR